MQSTLKELQIIPGIGKSLASDLYDLGIRKVSDLAKKDPQKLYDKLCDITQSHQDPCVLYTFRCAVYFARLPRQKQELYSKHGGQARTKHPKPELLKWWNWKDRVI